MNQPEQSCLSFPEWVNLANSWIAQIDFSHLPDWISALSTLGGLVIACLALGTWRKQIQLQDRYQKTDALLNGFLLCLRAGYNWQWEGGVGEGRKLQDSGDKYQLWRDALTAYRKDWVMAMPLLGSDEGTTLCFNPELLQSKVISAGAHLRNPSTSVFDKEMDKLMDDGVRGIIKLRGSK